MDGWIPQVPSLGKLGMPNVLNFWKYTYTCMYTCLLGRWNEVGLTAIGETCQVISLFTWLIRVIEPTYVSIDYHRDSLTTVKVIGMPYAYTVYLLVQLKVADYELGAFNLRLGRS